MHSAQRLTLIACCSWKLANKVQTTQPPVSCGSVSHQGRGACEATVQKQSPNSIPAEKHCTRCDRSRDGRRYMCEECTRELKGQPPLPEPTAHEKLCAFCMSIKPAAAFHRSSTVKTGLQSYCRECNVQIASARQRAYAQHNLELSRPAAHKRTCSQCKRLKALSEFDRDIYKSSGLYSMCKNCMTQHRKLHFTFVPFSKPSEGKLCSICNENRPAAEFYKDRRYVQGLATYCKECDRRRRKEGKVASVAAKSGLTGGNVHSTDSQQHDRIKVST